VFPVLNDIGVMFITVLSEPLKGEGWEGMRAMRGRRGELVLWDAFF
jgi:hypothetical protein